MYQIISDVSTPLDAIVNKCLTPRDKKNFHEKWEAQYSIIRYQ